MTWLHLLLQIFFMVNILFTVVIIFFERKNPTSTWAWIILLNLLPYFGFIIYLMFGLDSRKYKIFMDKSRNDLESYAEYLKLNSNSFITEQDSLMHTKNILQIPDGEHLNDLVYMNYKAGFGTLTLNNKLTLFNSGEDKFNELMQDIANAKNFVHMQYYIFRDDELGDKILNLLTQKAKDGVEVKLLIDGMGCLFNKQNFCSKLIEAGGEVLRFLPPRFFRVNFRNHRKICVIDGNIGYIGGFNIGDEYIGKSKRFGFWRDSHIKIFGDAVKQLEIRFIMDWNFCVTDSRNPSANQISIVENYFPKLQTIDCTSMQIVSSGPDTKWDSIQYSYFKMINEANKSIYIHSPYFIPDSSILEALRIAALSGIDVRVIIPSKPDHIFVYSANMSYIGELLDAGVKCYKYENGFLHSKLMIIDGIITSVGTANMDLRSFKLNFEINAFIYDKDTSQAFANQFITDLSSCTEILLDEYTNRSWFMKFKESISRLFSGLL